MRRPPFPQRMGVTIMHFNGLTDKQVEESRKKYGSNVIPDSEPTTFWAEFKETFKDPMIRILLAIAALMIVMCVLGYAEIYEPIGTVVAVLIVAFVSAKTGVASDTKYRQLKDSTKKDQCKVYRNGLVTVIDVDDVVVGDKVLLQSGDKVPADGVLIHGTLRVDNSALNGEAEECPKTAADESFPLPEDITGDTFVDAHSLFRGAVLFDGEGVLDVRKVGLATMMGKMAEEMQDDEPDSPLKVKLGKLADMISRFGYIGAVVIAIMYFGYFILSAGGFAAYFSSGAPVIIQDIVEAVSLAVVIIVCAVPEGLPLMISLVLMQNTSKMLDHNVLVRKAEGIETAGSLNILFSDKTGTITKGHLEVVEFFTADGVAIPLDQLAQQTKLKGLIDLAIGKNSQSMYDGSGRVVGGNATDQALMRFLGQETFHKLDEVSSYAVTKSQSFNSANKFSQAYIAGAGRTFYKGAPEKFLAVAQKYLSLDGDEHPLDLESLNAKIDELAGKSMRVLAFGYSPSEMTENAINADTVLIGLVGIRDDVRPEAREAIAEVQKAGIQVVMITGDRLETAVAIAREAGRLSDMVTQLLDVTYHGDAGTRTCFAPRQLLEDAAAVCRPVLQKNGNQLRLQCESSQTLCANHAALLQVLINLAINSNKHTGHGWVAFRAADAPGFVRFSVTDDGSGIAPDDLPHIFERGYGTDGGNGLGLTICRDIIESTGGAIAVTETNETGTTIAFTVPAQPEEAAKGAAT